ncbi:MAG: helix-turn-helix domain-containing protein [Patescibacteria group bacterium]|nr:helix-turn-helix domain-containing protein [Patescibacteria group bacterium]MCL5431788.1 helix-turn-helix domain-containing protein [Patescibacteria group bacterium]
MTTVGEILRQARENKKLTIEAVEKATKIRAKFVAAMEANEFDKLPGGTFSRGFIKNYATFLGLSTEETLAFFRRQMDQEDPRLLPKAKPEIKNRFALTPQLFTGLSIAALLLTFFAYLIFAYFKYAGAPALLVSAPANNIVVSQQQIEVTGKTDPGATLTINNQLVDTSENGSFDVTVPLQPGLNTLNIVAANKFHRQTTITRNLRLEK